jgi:hypothetical protein
VNCAKIAELFGGYLDGELDSRRRTALEAHLGSCAACRKTLAGYREAVGLCRSLGGREIAAPEGLVASVMTRVAATAAGRATATAAGSATATAAGRAVPPSWPLQARLPAPADILRLVRAPRFHRGAMATALAVILLVSGAAIQRGSALRGLGRLEGSVAGGRGQATGPTRDTAGGTSTSSSSQGKSLPAAGVPVAGAPAIKAGESSGGKVSGGERLLTVADTSQSRPQAAGGPLEDLRRKIIQTASLRVEVEDFNKSYHRILAITETAFGYVERSDFSAAGSSSGATPGTITKDGGKTAYPVPVPPPTPQPGLRVAYLTIRVPVVSFGEVMADLENLGTVRWRKVNSRDVTEEYADVEGRLAALRTHETRLLDILGRAKSVEELLKVEAELERVRASVESITRQMRTLANQINYSTVSVELSEVRKGPLGPEGPEGLLDRIARVFLDALRGVGTMLVGLLLFTAASLPWIVLLIVAGLVGRSLWKRRSPHGTSATGEARKD